MDDNTRILLGPGDNLFLIDNDKGVACETVATHSWNGLTGLSFDKVYCVAMNEDWYAASRLEGDVEDVYLEGDKIPQCLAQWFNVHGRAHHANVQTIMYRSTDMAKLNFQFGGGGGYILQGLRQDMLVWGNVHDDLDELLFDIVDSRSAAIDFIALGLKGNYFIRYWSPRCGYQVRYDLPHYPTLLQRLAAMQEFDPSVLDVKGITLHCTELDCFIIRKSNYNLIAKSIPSYQHYMIRQWLNRSYPYGSLAIISDHTCSSQRPHRHHHDHDNSRHCGDPCHTRHKTHSIPVGSSVSAAVGSVAAACVNSVAVLAAARGRPVERTPGTTRRNLAAHSPKHVLRWPHTPSPPPSPSLTLLNPWASASAPSLLFDDCNWPKPKRERERLSTGIAASASSSPGSKGLLPSLPITSWKNQVFGRGRGRSSVSAPAAPTTRAAALPLSTTPSPSLSPLLLSKPFSPLLDPVTLAISPATRAELEGNVTRSAVTLGGTMSCFAPPSMLSASASASPMSQCEQQQDYTPLHHGLSSGTFQSGGGSNLSDSEPLMRSYSPFEITWV